MHYMPALYLALGGIAALVLGSLLWDELSGFLLLIVGVFATVIGLISFFVLNADKASCEDWAKKTGVESSYTANGGCDIKFKGHWIDGESYDDVREYVK